MADRFPADAHLAAIEQALSTIVRQSKSPRQHERIAELGAVSLETSLYPVLRRVAEGVPRLTDLAELLGVELSTVSRQVRQLEDLGLVDRAADPDDGRAVSLSLTAAGRQALADFQVARRRRMAELLDDWSGPDRAELARLLTRLATAIEATAGSPAAGTRR